MGTRLKPWDTLHSHLTLLARSDPALLLPSTRFRIYLMVNHSTIHRSSGTHTLRAATYLTLPTITLHNVFYIEFRFGMDSPHIFWIVVLHGNL